MNQPDNQHGAQKRYQLSSFSRTEYGGYKSNSLTNRVALRAADAGADGGDIHNDEFLGCLQAKYVSSPRSACVDSYQKSSVLKWIRSHGVGPGKRTPANPARQQSLAPAANLTKARRQHE